MNIDALRSRLSEIETELRTIHTEAGDAALTDDQQVRWDALDTEDAEVRQSIKDAEEAEARAARVAESRARWSSLQVGTTVATDDVPVRSLSVGEVRDRSLKRLESREHVGHLGTEQVDKVDKMLRSRSRDMDGAKVGRALLATESDAYRSAFMKSITQTAPAFTADEARAVDEARAASLTDGAGGYGVPVLIDPTIVLTGQRSLNPLRRIARVESITTDAWKGVSSAGVTWSYDVEAAEVSDDAPTLVQPSVSVHGARGFIPYSIEISQDYPGFATEFGRLLAEGYDELQAGSFITGTGSDQPFGIVVALDANTNVEVAVTSDGVLQAADIDKVWTALPDRSKSNAVWLMNSDVDSYIALWGDAYGGRTVDLAGRATTLRGRPIELATNMPAFTGTTGAANILVVGDFRNYLIVDRVGMSVELVPHLFGTTNNRPTGQRGLFAMARHGADSINDDGFRLLQNT